MGWANEAEVATIRIAAVHTAEMNRSSNIGNLVVIFILPLVRLFTSWCIEFEQIKPFVDSWRPILIKVNRLAIHQITLKQVSM